MGFCFVLNFLDVWKRFCLRCWILLLINLLSLMAPQGSFILTLFFFPIICWSPVWLVINSSPVKGKNIKENSVVSMIGKQNDRLNYPLWYCLTGLTKFSFRGLWISFTELSWQPNGGRRAIGYFLKSGFLFGFIKMDLFLEGCIFHILAPSPSECG